MYADSAHQPHMIYKYSMQLCVATSIAMWYFTKNKKLVGNHTFVQAMCLSSFYHLGTCAFGSLILGKVVVLTACSLRIILYLYFFVLESHCKDHQTCFDLHSKESVKVAKFCGESSDDVNSMLVSEDVIPLIDVIEHSTKVCFVVSMCLLEKCIKFVNKNAYIQTAIHGHSFCKGNFIRFDVRIL